MQSSRKQVYLLCTVEYLLPGELYELETDGRLLPPVMPVTRCSLRRVPSSGFLWPVFRWQYIVSESVYVVDVVSRRL